MAQIPQQLNRQEILAFNNFKGYQNFTDKTILPFDFLTAPSQNCTVPSFDRVDPDKGKKILGQDYTIDSGIIGRQKKFSTVGGELLEVRVYHSNDANLKDVIEILYKGNWHRITENVNPLPVGPHEYYFSPYFDTNINPQSSRRLPRLLWTNGYENPSTKEGAVYSWTGGIAVITSFVPNSSISISSQTTWRSLGFTEDAVGNAYVIVNGISYQVLNTADLNTSTITVASTAGIAVNDIATSKIESDIISYPADMVLVNKNYAFYGNWKYRSERMSNAFNRNASQSITALNAVLDDLIIETSSSFLGTTEQIINVKIDSSALESSTISFNGTGANAMYINTSGYTQNGTRNVYKLVVYQVGGAGSNNQWGYILYKNNVQVDFGPLQDPATGTALGPTITTWDGITFNIPTLVTGNMLPLGPGPYTSYTGSLQSGDSWDVSVTTNSNGLYDTFQWSIDNVVQAQYIPITGLAQVLGSTGISIRFLSKTGHELGDTWYITGVPKVLRSWANFYYANNRRPGEGYIFETLPSNFWTMDKQEDSVYVNCANGEWLYITTELSSDLKSESVNMTPLKQNGSNKVLYPYLTGHIDDDLVFITLDKSLMSIGRKQFLEKPQSGYLSDPVKLDFLSSSFIGGSIEYIGKRLYISSPDNSITHCFDVAKGYWQPPKKFPEVGILSVVGNELICHSNIRNQSFTMFADNSDNKGSYTVIIASPSTALGARWKSKYSNVSFIEGRIEGAPPLRHTVFLGPDGCGGEYSHDLDVIVCQPNDRAPLGEGEHGSHSLGSDTNAIGTYFNEIYTQYSPALEYYFIGLMLTCTTKNHSYSILSMGMNASWSPTGNNSLINRNNLIESEYE